MNFTLPSGARKFFAAIVTGRSDGWLMFDGWYVCALLGLDERRLGAKDALESEPFLPEYPDAFKPHSDFIAGLLIDAELTRNDIDLTDKASVEREMILLLDPSRATGLSAKGIELLNRYAVAGFERLQTEAYPPTRVEDMMVRYATFWASGSEAPV